MSLIKSTEEIELLREGGKELSRILHKVAKEAKPGKTTAELNEMAENMIKDFGGRPSFKNYGDFENPFPSGLCTSVNEQLVHGIPSDYKLKNGDILSLDIGMEYPLPNGLYTDMAITVPVGKVDKKARQAIRVAKGALKVWTDNLGPGKDLNDIAGKVEKHIEKKRLSVVRSFVGHGVGHKVHEEPQIPNYHIEGFSFVLKPGMVIALEPMVSVGSPEVEILPDGWSAASVDKSLTGHWEHTVAITEKGCKIITK
ncbi:MAG TPA: type I methionyl aminopeptidase [Patescibacteria group bacterium]|nr:type I methionyl aminopeptidase [Patescibacteria group bacterium]